MGQLVREAALPKEAMGAMGVLGLTKEVSCCVGEGKPLGQRVGSAAFQVAP